jgi:hypothetical protein
MPASSNFQPIITFQTTCADCSHTFPAPALSDFAYAQFLLHGSSGATHAFLDAANEPACDIVKSHLPSTHPSDRFIHVMASIADPIHGQPLTPHLTCPHCHSRRIHARDDNPIETIQLPIATFHDFIAMSPDQQQARIRSLI